MDTKKYPSDLTDGQWALIAPLLPKAKPGGRPRKVDLRQIVNGILHVTRSGCSWRMLPRDFGSWLTVYDYFRNYRRYGTVLEIVKRCDYIIGFVILPRRWVVERTFAWLTPSVSSSTTSKSAPRYETRSRLN